MPGAYWLGAVIALILSVTINSWLIKLSHKKKWFVPAIRPRDEHSKPTPRVGGIGIVVAFLITIGLTLIFSSGSLSFGNATILGIDRNLVGFLLAIIWLSVINAFDDYRGLSWQTKLISQLIAAIIITGFGILIPTLSNPFGQQIVIGSYSSILVIVWLVVISNVINWLDSIDGVAGGVSSITLFILFLLSINVAVNQPSNAMLAIIGFGATLGFLLYNLRGKVFLGDTGSMFLGFLIGVLAIISGGKVATVFLVLAIPFLDALVVFISRISHHQSPFLADRRHLTHRLLDRGYSKKTILMIFYAISLIFGLIALNTQTTGKFWAVLVAMVVMALFILPQSRKKPNI
ncbi:MAG: MraY family glycosyltransferase [bacterium]|nr:MraY family glycosyltransferase [bacterium]